MTIDELEDGIQIEGPEGYANVMRLGDRWLICFEDGTDTYAENVVLSLWRKID